MKKRLSEDFHIRCDAQASGRFDASADGFSIAAGQRVARDGAEEMWDFVLVLARPGDNGTLTTRILLCHPEWEDPLQIAEIQSKPGEILVNFTRSPSAPT